MVVFLGVFWLLRPAWKDVTDLVLESVSTWWCGSRSRSSSSSSSSACATTWVSLDFRGLGLTLAFGSLGLGLDDISTSGWRLLLLDIDELDFSRFDPARGRQRLWRLDDDGGTHLLGKVEASVDAATLERDLLELLRVEPSVERAGVDDKVHQGEVGDGEEAHVLDGQDLVDVELARLDGLLVEVFSVSKLFVQHALAVSAEVLDRAVRCATRIVGPVRVDLGVLVRNVFTEEWFQGHLEVKDGQVLVRPADAPDDWLVGAHHAVELKEVEVAEGLERLEVLEGEDTLGVAIFVHFVVVRILIELVKFDRPEEVNVEDVAAVVDLLPEMRTEVWNRFVDATQVGTRVNS